MRPGFLFLQLLPLALAAPRARRSEPAPILAPRGAVIENKYIVKYKKAFSIASADHTLKTCSADADKVYSNIFHGFSGTLNASVIEQLRHHPDVRLGQVVDNGRGHGKC